MKDKIAGGHVRNVHRLGVHVRERVQTFEPFARQHPYIRVNEKLVDRMLKRLPGRKRYQLLDIAAGTGLMTRVAHLRARAIGAEIDAVLVDIDLLALREARKEVPGRRQGLRLRLRRLAALHGSIRHRRVRQLPSPAR